MNLTTLHEFIGFGELFPLRPGSKSPMKGWPWRKKNTTDLAQMVQWLELYPQSNWALIPSRCLVLDVDSKNGVDGFQSIQQYDPLPETLTVQTPSGGRHYYFQRPIKGAGTVNSLFRTLIDSIVINGLASFRWSCRLSIFVDSLEHAPPKPTKPQR